MDDYSDSTERSSASLVLFALAFMGFGIALGGVILTMPAVAIIGLIVLIASISAFGRRRSKGD